MTQIRNAGVVAPDKIESRGLIVLFEPDGQDAGSESQVDLGWTQDFAPDDATTEVTWTGNREGIEEDIKTETTKLTKAFTFGTLSSGDLDVIRLHTGGEIVQATGPAFAGVQVIAEGVALSTSGRLWIIRKTAIQTGLDVIQYFHRATLRGTPTTEDNGADVLNFRATVIADPTFTPPVTLATMGRPTPYGLRLLVPKAKYQAVLDATVSIAETQDENTP